MNIFTSFFKSQPTQQDRINSMKNDLLKREAKVGAQVFGPIPVGTSREFFCLEKNTWVWSETNKKDGKYVTNTTKYIIRPTELVKSVNGSSYQKTTLEEARRFKDAVGRYRKIVREDVYGLAA